MVSSVLSNDCRVGSTLSTATTSQATQTLPHLLNISVTYLESPEATHRPLALSVPPTREFSAGQSRCWSRRLPGEKWRRGVREISTRTAFRLFRPLPKYDMALTGVVRPSRHEGTVRTASSPALPNVHVRPPFVLHMRVAQGLISCTKLASKALCCLCCRRHDPRRSLFVVCGRCAHRRAMAHLLCRTGQDVIAVLSTA